MKNVKPPVTIKTNGIEEIIKVLRKIEKEYKGFHWSGLQPMGFIPKKAKHITLHSNCTISYCNMDFNFYNYKEITAKEFLQEESECIVIYRKGSETIALDKVTGEKAIAKCNPADTYDFMTGAKLALDRLTEPLKEEEEFKPHLLYEDINHGIIGEKTPFKDAIGRELRVGDTVELYNKYNEYVSECAVVFHYEKPFIMGIITDCQNNGEITNGWKIILKRKYEDIENGEVVDEIKYVKE